MLETTSKLDLYQLPSEESWLMFALRTSVLEALQTKAHEVYWETVPPDSTAVVGRHHANGHVEETRWTVDWDELGQPPSTHHFAVESIRGELDAFAGISTESNGQGQFDVLADDFVATVRVTTNDEQPDRVAFDLGELIDWQDFDFNRARLSRPSADGKPTTMCFSEDGNGVCYNISYQRPPAAVRFLHSLIAGLPIWLQAIIVLLIAVLIFVLVRVLPILIGLW